MRDPEARIQFTDTQVRRTLHRPLEASHFLRSSVAAALVAEDLLISHAVEDESTVVSPRVPFVTLPTEWPDSQLHDAALLTLQVAQRAFAAGFDLKDASAWNVIAEGTVGVFCDLMSFEPLRSKAWWAAGQFSRHFITPLWLARHRGVAAHRWLELWRDGVPADRARRLLGPSRYLSRCWPVVARGRGPERPAPELAEPQPRVEAMLAFRERLLVSLRWMLDGVVPPRRIANSGTSDWAHYVDQRSHYGAEGVEAKLRQIAEWLTRVPCRWVADFGCNTGEFTELALARGALVVALDGDHAVVEQLYRKHRGRREVFPVVATLDDLAGSRGWAGDEWPGLAQRLHERFDGVLMLALLHHLAVGAGVRLEDIARFARRCSRDWVIVEWLGQGDPQLLELCRQRRRDSAEFALERQRTAFVEAGFTIADEVGLPGCHRHLALLRSTR